MNVCRWCGGKSRESAAFCSPECAGAAFEMPELVHRSSEPIAARPRKVASPGRSWSLGLLAGLLIGVIATVALSNRPERIPYNSCQIAHAKMAVKNATLDFLQNGLGGIWDGRVQTSRDLAPWF